MSTEQKLREALEACKDELWDWMRYMSPGKWRRPQEEKAFDALKLADAALATPEAPEPRVTEGVVIDSQTIDRGSHPVKVLTLRVPYEDFYKRGETMDLRRVAPVEGEREEEDGHETTCPRGHRYIEWGSGCFECATSTEPGEREEHPEVMKVLYDNLWDFGTPSTEPEAGEMDPWEITDEDGRAIRDHSKGKFTAAYLIRDRLKARVTAHYREIEEEREQAQIQRDNWRTAADGWMRRYDEARAEIQRLRSQLTAEDVCEGFRNWWQSDGAWDLPARLLILAADRDVHAPGHPDDRSLTAYIYAARDKRLGQHGPRPIDTDDEPRFIQGRDPGDEADMEQTSTGERHES